LSILFVLKEQFHWYGIQILLHHPTSRRQLDCLFMAEPVFPSYVDSAYFWHCLHNGQDKPDFFFQRVLCTIRYRLLSTRVCFPVKVVESQSSVLRNFDPLFLHTRYLAVGDTRLLKQRTLLLVCVVITSRQLHVVCISCFNSTPYEVLFFTSYVTNIHSLAALAVDEWACLYPVIKADVRNPKTWFYDEIVYFNRRIPFFLWGSVSLDLSRKREILLSFHSRFNYSDERVAFKVTPSVFLDERIVFSLAG
jgi:hypothetical protein